MTFTNSAAEFEQILRASAFKKKGGDPISQSDGINAALALLRDLRESKKSLYIIGNGGSAAVASHIVNDFCNGANLRAISFNEPSLLTCYGNDYGYEHIFSKRIENLAQPGDLLIAVSSSGNSENIIRAVSSMHSKNGNVFTLSGFDKSNSLQTMGDLNCWVDSHSYGHVEIAHLFILHYLADTLKASPHFWETQKIPSDII